MLVISCLSSEKVYIARQRTDHKQTAWKTQTTMNMPPPTKHGSNFNEEMRKYVNHRDKLCCQWPGCGNTLNVDVLFIVETDNGGHTNTPYYKNGITLCPKHMEIVNLHDKAFGPLVYDLIQLVEFENDLQATEKMYKDLLK